VPADLFAHLFRIVILVVLYLDLEKQMSANHNQIIDSGALSLSWFTLNS